MAFVFLISFFCFGCENQDLKTSLITSNPEEEMIPSRSIDQLDSPIEKVKKKDPVSDFPEEKIEAVLKKEPVAKSREVAVLENEVKDQISVEFVGDTLKKDAVKDSVKKEPNELLGLESSLDKGALELNLEKKEVDSEADVLLLKKELIRKILLDEGVPEDVLKVMSDEKLFESVSDEELSIAFEEDGFSSSASKEELIIYSPNRNDLDAFYETLQAQNKLMVSNFSLFCGVDCDDFDLGKADVSTIFVEIQYTTVDGKKIDFICSEEGCFAEGFVFEEKEIGEEIVSPEIVGKDENLEEKFSETADKELEKELKEVEKNEVLEVFENKDLSVFEKEKMVENTESVTEKMSEVFNEEKEVESISVVEKEVIQEEEEKELMEELDPKEMVENKAVTEGKEVELEKPRVIRIKIKK